MPKIRRWFNVSHDINSDPEVWELTDKFGDRGLRAWLECLSIADRNDGYVPGDQERLVRAFSIKLNTPMTKVSRLFRWFVERAWLLRRGHETGTTLARGGNVDATWTNQDAFLRVRSYLDYKPKREAKKNEQGSPPRQPSETSEPTVIKNPDPAPPAPSADSKKKELDPRIKAVADRIFKSNPVKFARLIQWIKQAEKYDYPKSVIAETLERFEPRSDEVDRWYAWLDKVIEKLRTDYNRDQSLLEHEKHKNEIRETAQIYDFSRVVKDA